MKTPFRTPFSRIYPLPLHPTSFISRPLQASQIRPGFSKVSVRRASQWGPPNRYRSPQYNRFGRAGNLYNLWYTSPAFRYGLGAAGLGAGTFYYLNLERVPISGRLRFNCFSPRFGEQMADMQKQSILQEFRGRVLPPHHPYSIMVDKVMQRLIPASGLENLNWEVTVIDDPDQANAFVMPGGKVFVFSGILPICGGEDGLAAVLGHEISHQLANHTGEKMSENLYLMPLVLLAAYYLNISGSDSSFLFDLILTKPGSRKMEVRAAVAVELSSFKP